jgi:glycosyltransferase involved in cell wall biosynthesis
MALESLIENVDGIFILDTGSTDGTQQVIKEYARQYPNISFEFKHFGADKRFGIGFMEKDARQYAMSKALDLFKPQWIIQCDADEVYNDRYFEIVNEIYGKFTTFAHSTSMPVTPCRMSNNSVDYRMMAGKKMFDPHIRSWDTKLDFRWVHYPSEHATLRNFTGGVERGIPETFSTMDHVHFHLHRAFGPKSLYTWFVNKFDISKELGLSPDQFINPKIYEERFPENFKNGRFIPPQDFMDMKLAMSEPITHKLPSYTLHKWNQWWIFCDDCRSE